MDHLSGCLFITSYNSNKNLTIEPPRGLYKWSRIFNRLQRNFFIDEIELRREKQIHDFIVLNNYEKIKFKIDTDVFQNLKHLEVDRSVDADLTVITDQKFSRYPCPALIQKIQEQMLKCPRLYLCLNRHYINIDNSYHDTTLNSNFNLAITEWLKKNLNGLQVIDLSLDYIDYGHAFTWALPDRHYFIQYEKNN